MTLVDEIRRHLSALGVEILEKGSGVPLRDYVDRINSGDVVTLVNMDGEKYVIVRVDVENGQVILQSIESGEETAIKYDPNMNVEIEMDDKDEDVNTEPDQTMESVLKVKTAYKYINDGKYKGKVKVGANEYIITYVDPTKWVATTEDGDEIQLHPNQLVELV